MNEIINVLLLYFRIHVFIYSCSQSIGKLKSDKTETDTLI